MAHPHPTQTGRLTLLIGATVLMGVCGLAGLASPDLHQLPQFAPVFLSLVVVSFALFVVFIAAATFGWIIREHEMWRHDGGPARATARQRQQAQADRPPHAQAHPDVAQNTAGEGRQEDLLIRPAASGSAD
ncbi:hypothetical protein Cme02nite_40970 [Catellatospora methionotrophica]|uniref:Uncharacterized protein n=1 Tax=Catellatospora methionotrophica TaxID=121620 RepID=A0A8J3LN61_9ACTN|nr:hypothetical protein [Catellatospora methionotrophica]GIG15765.1 hypothetical protein Cme02nite_40970 [Catellatospora methionotrophica]